MRANGVRNRPGDHVEAREPGDGAGHGFSNLPDGMRRAETAALRLV
jgi:hypothetical protein